MEGRGWRTSKEPAARVMSLLLSNNAKDELESLHYWTGRTCQPASLHTPTRVGRRKSDSHCHCWAGLKAVETLVSLIRLAADKDLSLEEL